MSAPPWPAGDRPDRGKVIVVGSGVAGLTAAYLLQRRYDVTLVEAGDRFGGHADTHDVLGGSGRWLGIDTGFIVHNTVTYPLLSRLFSELDVATLPTEMSMSISCTECGLEYAGSRGIGGAFAQPKRAADPRFLRMLAEITRFHRAARRLLAADADAVDSISLAGFVALHRFSRYLVAHFLVPLVSAVWSTGPALALRYPARYLFRFLDHHGMLQVTGSPPWRTVVGGSRTYVDRAVKHLTAAHISTPVRSVTRHADGVEVRDSSDRVFLADHVVIATHPDQALRMLTDPTKGESDALSAIPYSTNSVVLHTDSRLLPSAPRARSSWNYTVPSCGGDSHGPAAVSYWMNRLQQLDEDTDYVVTLNGEDLVDPGSVIAKEIYHHPVYTAQSVAAQRQLPRLTTGRTAYAGAYHGWGFHEDGCASGVAAASALGMTW